MPPNSADQTQTEPTGTGARGAVALARARVAANPDDWAGALALKDTLAKLGQYAEGDAVFQEARRRFPDTPWATHMAALYAFPQNELPSLIARARSLAAAPGDPALPRLLGDMLMQARDYAGAGAAYAEDPRPDARLKQADAGRFAALTRQLAHAPNSGLAPEIAIINLDRNTGRLADMNRSFALCRPPRFRVPGVEGSRLSSAAVQRLGGNPAMRGTLGCFLSHAAAWEAMLTRGLTHCLVVEDDVIPLFDLPAQWGCFNLPDTFPETFDVCFVNDRLAPPATHAVFAVHTLSEALAVFPPWRNAAGTDGYLLSAAGAAKLLDWVARDGFAGDVDWRLVAYGLSSAQRAELPTASCAREALLRFPASPDVLSAFVMTPPLIRTVPLCSDREDGNRMFA